MKIKPTFHVTFDIEQDKLPTVLQVLTKEVFNLQITSDTASPIQTMKTTRKKSMPPRLGNEKSVPELLGDWIRQKPAGTEFTRTEVQNFLISKDIKPSNASPALSYCMNKLNLIVSPSRSLYRRK